MENSYSFTAAVRGFHYYRKYWKPQENEKLHCTFEENNPYDRFAIKTVTADGKTVGHLPREISRVTKFFLDRGAVMFLELTSKHYRRSPLVQGGMEIACLVTVKIPATMKNTQLAERYIELVRERYTEPKNEEIMGCYVTDITENDVFFTIEQKEIRNPQKKKNSPKNKNPPKIRTKQMDIRTMFGPALPRPQKQNRSNDRRSTEEVADVIQID